MLNRTMAVAALLAVAGVALYAAPKTVDSFEFKFETKADIEGWKANDPSTVEWKEGGAGGSAGCLKAIKEHCAVDAPATNFTANDNVISFDYYVHGTDAIRMRLMVSGEDNIKKYGPQGNLFLRKIEADKWQHAEAKLVDIPGSLESNKAKGYPELTFRGISFMTIEKAGDDAYILIDNLKMGKAGGAASGPTSGATTKAEK